MRRLDALGIHLHKIHYGGLEECKWNVSYDTISAQFAAAGWWRIYGTILAESVYE